VGKWLSGFFNLPKRGEDLQQYKVQNDDQEKRENVASLHRKNFSSQVEVEVVSSNTGHIYRFLDLLVALWSTV
jgi:hypothetical protein